MYRRSQSLPNGGSRLTSGASACWWWTIAQTAQLDNLVKIYETMKPEEAAKIFDTLDMPILLGVIQKMKPARTAPIMAKMPPEKAKEVTVALTKQDQLPQVK